jgi:hypothetical protein
MMRSCQQSLVEGVCSMVQGVEALAVIDHNVGATQPCFPVTLCSHYFCDQRFIIVIARHGALDL